MHTEVVDGRRRLPRARRAGTLALAAMISSRARPRWATGSSATCPRTPPWRCSWPPSASPAVPPGHRARSACSRLAPSAGHPWLVERGLMRDGWSGFGWNVGWTLFVVAAQLSHRRASGAASEGSSGARRRRRPLLGSRASGRTAGRCRPRRAARTAMASMTRRASLKCDRRVAPATSRPREVRGRSARACTRSRLIRMMNAGCHGHSARVGRTASLRVQVASPSALRATGSAA